MPISNFGALKLSKTHSEPCENSTFSTINLLKDGQTCSITKLIQRIFFERQTAVEVYMVYGYRAVVKKKKLDVSFVSSLAFTALVVGRASNSRGSRQLISIF